MSTNARILKLHPLLPRCDEDFAAAAKGCAQVDRAVRQYQRRVARGDWPTFTPPPPRLKAAA